MQLNVPPDLETLINKRLSSGGYTNAEEVLRRALERGTEEEAGLKRNAGRCHCIEGRLSASRARRINR